MQTQKKMQNRFLILQDIISMLVLIHISRAVGGVLTANNQTEHATIWNAPDCKAYPQLLFLKIR